MLMRARAFVFSKTYFYIFGRSLYCTVLRSVPHPSPSPCECELRNRKSLEFNNRRHDADKNWFPIYFFPRSRSRLLLIFLVLFRIWKIENHSEVLFFKYIFYFTSGPPRPLSLHEIFTLIFYWN
jgi:hypothetical protein